MPSATLKKTAAKSIKPASVAPVSMHEGHAVAWHCVLWIAVVAVTLSGATIALSAMAQGSTEGYTSNSEGILQAISDVRSDIQALQNRIDVMAQQQAER